MKRFIAIVAAALLSAAVLAACSQTKRPPRMHRPPEVAPEDIDNPPFPDRPLPGPAR